MTVTGARTKWLFAMWFVLLSGGYAHAGQFKPDPNTVLLMHFSRDNSLLDSSGSGLSITRTPDKATKRTARGIFGSGMFFSGSHGEFLDCAKDPSLDLTDKLTIEFWFYPRKYPQRGGAAKIINKMTSTENANYSFYFWSDELDENVSSSRTVQVLANAGGKWQGVSGAGIIPELNQWYHIAWTYDSEVGGSLYINGQLQGSCRGHGKLAVNDSNLRIGKGIHGIIDELRISNTIRYRRDFDPNFTAASTQPQLQDKDTVVLGILKPDAEKYDVEFQAYDRRLLLFKKHNIQASLVELWNLYAEDMTEGQIYGMLKPYHVIHLSTTQEGITTTIPDEATMKKRSAAVCRALARYVSEGGGLFLAASPVRYPNNTDEKYWNMVIEPFGAQILHEGLFDKTRSFEGITRDKETFWFTEIVQPHPATKGVKRICLPLHGDGPWPGVVAMQYSGDWEILVRGEKQARSYASSPTNNDIDPNVVGTYKESPPVLAVRTYGKGRIVSYPISKIFTGDNFGNPLWSHIVESFGDKAKGLTSDGMRMQLNCYEWLSEPARRNPELGFHTVKPYKEVEFPDKVNWDHWKFGPLAQTGGVRGIAGLHSSYSDGNGTVEEYVKAAKAAGLSFIVFIDPLEKLTTEKLEKLKEDCREASRDSDFYACPGVEFTDGIGDRWALWGEKILFPVESFVNYYNPRYRYVQWDGQRVRHYGEYEASCGYPGSALLDYKQLRANKAYPETLFWFFHIVPFAYEGNKLFADNFSEYLAALRRSYFLNVISFTRITDPKDIEVAAETCFMSLKDLATVKRGLNTHFSSWDPSLGEYVSQGPKILLWQAINSQMEQHIRLTRGAQRVRLKFIVQSGAGIRDVKVHDSDFGVIRRFEGNGAAQLEREFELVQDKQHYLVLEVTDTKGKRAISQYLFIYSYKNGLFRCGDNLNYLSTAGLCFTGVYNDMIQVAHFFENGRDFALSGWDSATAVAPLPAAHSCMMMNIKDVGWYPVYASPHTPQIMKHLTDVPLGSYNLQILTMKTGDITEGSDTEKRPGCPFVSPPTDLAPNEYFEREHTIYSPMDRVDNYVALNNRRDREGRKNYRGNIIWSEGKIEFKKDVTLAGDVPIPLVRLDCPLDLSKKWGDTLVVTDADKGARIAKLEDLKNPLAVSGRISQGGYAARMPSLVGFNGFLAPRDTDFAYVSQIPGETYIGLGQDGQKVKAGTVMNYRFGVATFADSQADKAILKHTAKALNMGGGQGGYPIEMKVGKFEDATFFFTAAAENNEALFVLGPQELIIDLPIRVRGLEDNGCAAVYSSQGKWFRFISVVKDTAYFQAPIEKANEMWAGNIFVCDDKAVKITVVVDGQSQKAKPFIEVHNRTEKEIATTIWSPANTPIFGGLRTSVTLPAGDSIRLRINGADFVPF